MINDLVFLFASITCTIAMVWFSAFGDRLSMLDLPQSLRGLPVRLISAGSILLILQAWRHVILAAG